MLWCVSLPVMNRTAMDRSTAIAFLMVFGSCHRAAATAAPCTASRIAGLFMTITANPVPCDGPLSSSSAISSSANAANRFLVLLSFLEVPVPPIVTSGASFGGWFTGGLLTPPFTTSPVRKSTKVRDTMTVPVHMAHNSALSCPAAGWPSGSWSHCQYRSRACTSAAISGGKMAAARCSFSWSAAWLIPTGENRGIQISRICISIW
mmetsp:Transcript_17917/g.43060  ORF Transcript_17917/g.43060 Transcript_17917/m.43060 type:complete len:206 (-) Transcript_17917:580-1197(-)